MSHEVLTLLQPLAPRLVRFKPGQPVFRLGDPVRNVHVVHRGLMCLVRYQSNGNRLILQRATAGSVLAEASVFSKHYHCDATSMGETEAWIVSRDVVRERITCDGEFAREWARMLGQELQKARLQAEILSIRTVEGRLDAWLAWHGSMPRKGEWSGLAAEIGVSPEALYRELAKRGD